MVKIPSVFRKFGKNSQNTEIPKGEILVGRYVSRKASDFFPFVAKKAGGEMPSKKETPS